jgi:hypothetical protein
VEKIKAIYFSIHRYVRIGLISSIIAFLFFHFLLDSILTYANDFLLNSSVIFLASFDPIFNGSRIHFSQDPELDTLLTALLGICSISVIIVSVMYYLRLKLNNFKQLAPNSDYSLNKESWTFQILTLLKKKWIFLSLSMIIFIIVMLSLSNLFFSSVNNFRL